MKKKIVLFVIILTLMVCAFALCVSAKRVENYEATFTLRNGVNITHYEKWFYNEGKNYVRKGYTDAITVTFIDEDGNELTQVPMWEYDENEGKYYSLVWYISDYELFSEDQIYSDANVGEQVYPKYTSAIYTISKVRAVDLRYLTHQYGTKFDAIDSWKESRTLKSIEGIYYDINNTPGDTTDDLRLQDAVGIGRDQDNYGYVGYEAQWAATGNKIVVGNFRDCDFQRDVEGNYGTANTWSRADNLQCLWYPDTMLYISAGIGPIYEVDFGDGMEIINCQILRDNKRVKEIKIPNSVLYLSNEAFRGADITTLIIGENLVKHGNDPFLYTGGADNIYISKNVLTSLESSIPKLIANHSATIYFDGDLEQATALMNKIIEQDSNYSSKTSITLVDYKTTTERESSKGVVIFYNYNTCQAFYMGQHNGVNKLVFDETLGYFANVQYATVCDKCKETAVIDTISPIFVWKGYSKSTYGDTYAVVQGFYIDRDSLAQYKVYAPDFDFGIMATGNAKGEAIKPQIGDEKVFTAIFDNTVNDYYDVKITGINADLMDKNIVFCIYVLDSGKMYYLDGEKTADTVVGISYNNIA